MQPKPINAVSFGNIQAEGGSRVWGLATRAGSSRTGFP